MGCWNKKNFILYSGNSALSLIIRETDIFVWMLFCKFGLLIPGRVKIILYSFLNLIFPLDILPTFNFFAKNYIRSILAVRNFQILMGSSLGYFINYRNERVILNLFCLVWSLQKSWNFNIISLVKFRNAYKELKLRHKFYYFIYFWNLIDGKVFSILIFLMVKNWNLSIFNLEEQGTETFLRVLILFYISLKPNCVNLDIKISQYLMVLMVNTWWF